MAISNKVCKGSGYIYVRKLTEENKATIPKIADITKLTNGEATAWLDYLKALRKAANELGYIKNGYEFATQITMLEDQSDMGQLKVQDIQDEKGTSKFALFNADGETIQKMYPMAQTGYDETSKLRVTAIGGKGNQNNEIYEVLFVHPDTANGDVVIYSQGQNFEGLTIGYKPSAVTPLNCTYQQQALDDTGRMAYMFDMPKEFKWELE